MYFISSLILLHVCKVFPFRPTCGSYDSEIKKKKDKKSQKGPAKKVNKVQVILCFNLIKIIFLLGPCDHLVAKQKKLASAEN
jgi:hypothetical protein